MRIADTDGDRATEKVPNPWALVNDPEEFWGDLGTRGRRLLRDLLEGTMEVWRDEWVGLDPYEADPNRKTYRNGYFTRKRGATALSPPSSVRVPGLPGVRVRAV